ncbi:MAG: radical SAM protein [Bacteroidetes bacterium]|nr:radical SAM protein [Bacteroidota bacterium]
MNSFPIEYNEPLFRPPSEADSLILQVTYGCTWNHCSFCEIYTTKTFSAKKEEDILREIRSVAAIHPDVRKVFLADGNPMALSAKRLLNILSFIKQNFPKVRKVSTYALPRDILAKTKKELKELKEAGLTMVYVGIESGDDEVLRMMDKGETFSSVKEGLLLAKEACIKLSVIILEGVGGMKYSEQHALNSAKILNEIQPEFASVLVLSFPFGIERYIQRFRGEYIPMGIPALLNEMKIFISNIHLKGTIFRSNHASNYLVLNGILSRDKELFLEKIEFALKHPEFSGLRQEWQRGL